MFMNGNDARRRWCAVGLIVAAGVGSACGSSNPAAPSGAATAVIRVSGETFRVLLTTAAQIQAARAAQQGGPARISNGRIVMGAQVNLGYSWHLEDVEFAEVTIEVCDGRPSDVQRDGPAFGGGRFCPWGAQVLSVSR